MSRLLLMGAGNRGVSGLLTDLVSHWRMDEASGNAIDIHGGNTLTDNNTVTSAAGLIGTSRSFAAASNEYFSIADNAGLSGGNRDFTIAAWIYPTLAGVAETRTVLGKGGGANWEFALRVPEDAVNYRDPQFIVSSDGTAGFTVANYSATTVLVNTWHLLMCWHDSVNNLIGIQLNNLSAQTTAFSAGVYDGAAAFQIGQVDSGNYWNGRIDSVSRWNRMLTAGERTQLYNSGAGLDYPF